MAKQDEIDHEQGEVDDGENIRCFHLNQVRLKGGTHVLQPPFSLLHEERCAHEQEEKIATNQDHCIARTLTAIAKGGRECTRKGDGIEKQIGYEKPETKGKQQRLAIKNATDEQHGQLKEQRTQRGKLFLWGKMAEKPQEKT